MSMLSRPTFREKSAILDKRRPPVIMKAEKGGDRMKRLFTRRTAGMDAKVDRLVMEYARRSAASPLLQHTERLVLDRSEGIAHLSSVGKHTAERRCSLPSAAAACSTRSRRDCYRRLLPPGRTMPRRAMRSRCAGRTARRSALPAAMTARAFRTAGQSLPPRQIPCCASIRRASCSTRRAQPPRRAAVYCAVEFEPHGTCYSYRSRRPDAGGR